MKKVLFIDRDGTIIWEPPTDFQIDSLEKLEFLPKVISNLRKIAEEAAYELVMVTNQDGLGTASFPEDTFWPAHHKMLKTLEGENVKFSAIHIDRHFPEENSPERKPGTGMLTRYFSDEYDLKNSYVIGDRATDVQLAVNLGAKAILIAEQPVAEGLDPEQRNALSLVTTDWDAVYERIKLNDRLASVERNTKETRIKIGLNLDGTGRSSIHTGLGFFDHMLDQVARHGGIDLDIHVDGDLHIDEHHTIEDTGLALGEAFRQALGDKKGVARYGFLLPMDEALAQVAVDFSGRPWLVWDAEFKREKVGDMPTEMFHHFFKSFSDTSLSNINIRAEGANEHHKIESIFKGFAKAIKMAVKRDLSALHILPSTKGVL
ncbi:MAG: bifunctional imidazole glycerol-phosphate dehydratase/histidinol phosphatase [Cytophagaceae bacterium SCN 52-12]|nr:MAG: bifunctional imidazole glycerol-phosphate dehydratase/histidinol phosphatase [Cytophagaceae bacterium SCN 52-12]